jgi:hypothetical protein
MGAKLSTEVIYHGILTVENVGTAVNYPWGQCHKEHHFFKG